MHLGSTRHRNGDSARGTSERTLRFGRRRPDSSRPTSGLPAEAGTDPEIALAMAATLADAGQALDAIALLTNVNRAHRDHRIDRRLVELRSRAFLEGDWSAPAPLRADVEDRFPDAAIPEIDASELSVDAVRSALWHHGSLIVRGLLAHERVERLVTDMDHAFAAFDARAQRVERPDVEAWYEPFTRDCVSNRERKRFRGSIMTIESPPTLFDLVEALETSGVAQLARDYLGERPVLLARKGTLRRVARTGRTGGWHQDGAFMGEIRSLNVWFALSDCGDVAPGLDVVGRRLDAILPTGEGFAPWMTSPGAAERAAAGATVRPIFRAGDALILDHVNLHRTAIDPGMEHDRDAIETWLMAPSTYGAMTAKVESGYPPRDQLPIVL